MFVEMTCAYIAIFFVNLVITYSVGSFMESIVYAFTEYEVHPDKFYSIITQISLFGSLLYSRADGELLTYQWLLDHWFSIILITLSLGILATAAFRFTLENTTKHWK